MEAVLSDGQICLEGLDVRQEGEEGAAVNTGCQKESLTYMSRKVPCFFVATEEKEKNLSKLRLSCLKCRRIRERGMIQYRGK